MRKQRTAAPRVDAGAFRELTGVARALLRVAVAVQALAAAFAVVPYVGMWLVAQEAMGAGRPPVIWAGVGVIAVAAVAGLLAKLLAYTLSHRADLRVQRVARRRVAEHLARLPLGWFSGGAGKALDTLQGDVEELHAAVAHGRMEVVTSLVTPVLAACWLVFVDWRLTILLLLPSIAVYFQQRRALSGAGERQRGVMVALSSLMDAINELVRELPTLRVVRRGAGAAERMLAASDRFRTAQSDAFEVENRRSVRNGALVDPVTTMALVIGAGGVMVAAGWMPLPDLLPFALVAVVVSSPLQDIATARAGMRSAYLAAERIRDLLNTAPLSQVGDGGPPRDATVVLRDVTFGYGTGPPVLREVNLELRPGTMTALVGPSGAGKSTVAALLARFYDVDRGSVLIGGVDVREMTARDLYAHVGFVLQDAMLIRTSILDNIRLARPGATRDDVVAAARAARIHERITALPQGYDSIAGVDARMSGGERQRVAIARLLLADPAVLVLDEATAHVDPETEAEVQAALANLAEGRTVLVIAHRLSTVVDVDQTVVLDEGDVVQTGRHRDLIEVDGVYRRLWAADRNRERVA